MKFHYHRIENIFFEQLYLYIDFMSKIQLLEASELIHKVPDFKEIFKEHDIATSYKKFQEFGGLESILRICKTDPKRGLPDNEAVL